MMRLIPVVFLISIGSGSYCQKLVTPSNVEFTKSYFKNSTVFQKLTWIDKSGQITRQATLNLVTKIDSVQHRLTHLQIRNDGKKDSSVATLPSLKPIYVSSVGKGQKVVYDYSEGRKIKVLIERDNTVEYKGDFTMPEEYFDGFLSEYLLGALPLKVGFSAQFEIYRGDTKKNGAILIKSVMCDVLVNGVTTSPSYVLTIVSGNFEYLVWVDMKTGQVLKTVFTLPDGGYFVKERV